MDDALMNAVVSIALGIIGVASLAVILSKNSNTQGVISTSGAAFSGSLATALSPVTGSGAGSQVFSSGFGSSLGLTSPQLSLG
jgi:hypothetical protein